MTFSGAFAVIVALLATEPLDDPDLEARAQGLMREIRCVACENEPVSQSAAPIAEDMRARIRAMVADGSSDGEVRDWFEARYGAHALFRPPARGPGGWALWLAPFALLAAGAAVALSVARGRMSNAVQSVAPEDTDP